MAERVEQRGGGIRCERVVSGEMSEEIWREVRSEACVHAS